MRRLPALIVCLACTSALASATTVIPLTFDQLVAEADVIVESVVVDVRSRAVNTAGGQVIVTDVSFRPVRVLKGRPPRLLVMEFLGGTVGGLTMGVGDMPQFEVGNRDVIFARPGRREASSIAGFMQGRFPIVVDPVTGRESVRRFDGALLTSPAQIGLPPQPFLSRGRALSLADFQTAVSDEVARQGNRPPR
jgi:hypothetical protein